MTNDFNGYTDAFAASHKSTSSEESAYQKLARKYRKTKKENKEMKRAMKEQRAAEEKRIAEQRVAEEARKKENSLWSRIGDAVIKAIPAIIAAVVPFFMKNFTSRRNECKCA